MHHICSANAPTKDQSSSKSCRLYHPYQPFPSQLPIALPLFSHFSHRSHPSIAMASRSLHRRRLGALLLCLALSCRRWLWAQVLGPRLAATPLAAAEVARIHAAVRSRALEAIAEGKLPPGRELELISALDLETVPWSRLVGQEVVFADSNMLCFPHQTGRKGNLSKTASLSVDDVPKFLAESSLNPQTYREGVWKRSFVALGDFLFG
jgi:hypothetical protein